MATAYENAGWDGSVTAGVEVGRLIFDVASVVQAAGGVTKLGVSATTKTAKVIGELGQALKNGELIQKATVWAGKKFELIVKGESLGKEVANLFSAAQGKDLAKLSNKQIGDLGEEISKAFLRDNDHTEILAIQNNSGNGIDVVSRAPDGRIIFSEVKTSRTGSVGDLSARQKDMMSFVEDVLEQASSGTGRYQNISIADQQLARQLLREVSRDPSVVSGNVIGVDLEGQVLRISSWPRN
jgi:filamentous hemagglutinin